MLQAFSRARRNAHPLDVVVRALAAQYATVARRASASTESDEAHFRKATGLIDQVALFCEHPRALLEVSNVVNSIQNTKARPKLRLAAELAANPVVKNRQGVIRQLLAHMTDAVNKTFLHSSHADAIAQLSAMPADGVIRDRSLGLIVRMRYDDAPFVRAQDVISALPLLEPKAVIGPYLWTLPVHLHRLQLKWERDALAGRGSSVDEVRRAAAEQLLAVEEHVLARYPSVLEDKSMRSFLLRAFAAAREPAHAQRHWRWLLDHLAPIETPTKYLDSRLAAARDLAGLAAVWDEVRAAVPRIVVDHQGATQIRHKVVEGLLVLHHARLDGPGAAHDFFGYRPSATEHWAPLARAAGALGMQAPGALPLLQTSKALRASGMDWDGIAFMLGPFSPYLRILSKADGVTSASARESAS